MASTQASLALLESVELKGGDTSLPRKATNVSTLRGMRWTKALMHYTTSMTKSSPMSSKYDEICCSRPSTLFSSQVWRRVETAKEATNRFSEEMRISKSGEAIETSWGCCRAMRFISLRAANWDTVLRLRQG